MEKMKPNHEQPDLELDDEYDDDQVDIGMESRSLAGDDTRMMLGLEDDGEEDEWEYDDLGEDGWGYASDYDPEALDPDIRYEHYDFDGNPKDS